MARRVDRRRDRGSGDACAARRPGRPRRPGGARRARRPHIALDPLGTGSPCGPGTPWGPCMPAGPAGPIGPGAPGAPGGRASPRAPGGPAVLRRAQPVLTAQSRQPAHGLRFCRAGSRRRVAHHAGRDPGPPAPTSRPWSRSNRGSVRSHRERDARKRATCGESELRPSQAEAWRGKEWHGVRTGRSCRRRSPTPSRRRRRCGSSRQGCRRR
jgi:hypothetical protein